MFSLASDVICIIASLVVSNVSSLLFRYNVLSFKFMLPEPVPLPSTSAANSTESVRPTANSSSTNRSGDQGTGAGSRKKTKRNSGPKSSSASSSTAQQQAQSVSLATTQDDDEDSKYASGTVSSDVLSRLKEESSDESTVISSQTSTLTRNQDPTDAMAAVAGALHVDDYDASDDDEEDDDDDEEDDEDYDDDEDSSDEEDGREYPIETTEADALVAQVLGMAPSDGNVRSALRFEPIFKLLRCRAVSIHFIIDNFILIQF